MSIGPENKEPDTRVKGNYRAPRAIKKAIIGFFDKPLHYIFYITFFATIIGLYFGMEFNWKYYVLFGILALIKILNIKEDNG